jgi:hypothetical protein
MRIKDDYRKSDVFVEVLDLSVLEPQALQFIQQQKSESNWAKVWTENFARVETSEGIYALSYEGGGNSDPITDENPMGILFWAKSDPYEGEGKNGEKGEMQIISSVPLAEILLGSNDIRTIPVKEVVNLADFIRRDKARCEDNFHFWNDTLSPIYCGNEGSLGTRVGTFQNMQESRNSL